MRRLFGFAGVVLWAIGCGQSLAAPPAANPAIRVASDFDKGNSMTGGIQEAIDSLPAGGGMVYIPEGIYILHRPVRLKPNMKLIGAGKATVLKKDPGFKMLLAEDAQRGQDYVAVADASRFKPGMAIAIGDKKNAANIWSSMFLITKIEGNQLFIDHILGRGGLRYDVTVAEAACLMNLFMVILPAADCIIEDLEIDGSRSEQPEDDARAYGWPYGMLWAGIYPANQLKVHRCWIHDAGIGIHVNGKEVEISHCQVYNCSGDGIHCGGGPGSFITNNRIYHNGAGGISFCYGNKGLIITGNHIYDNVEGIKALGINDPKIDTIADQITIISNNLIYRNKLSGIASGQGWIGPQDFVFSGNIIKDNGQSGRRGLGPHDIPAGITLFNAQRCVVTGNRCLDDQDGFPRKLAKSAEADQSTITVENNVFGEGRWIVISDGENSEIQQVAKADGANLTLSGKLVRNYPQGAMVTGRKTQFWGIFVGGPDAVGNVIAQNVCDGNIIGGILWHGPNTRVADNTGKTLTIDPNQPPEESVYPALRKVKIPNPGFEGDSGWQGTFDKSAHTGKRAAKLTKTEEKGVADATSDFFPLKTNTRYRLTAWVKSNAKRGDQLILPYLFLYSKDAQPVGDQTRLIRTLDRPTPVEPMTWIRVSTEAFTRAAPLEARIYCRLERAVGEAWVDDILLEELD